MCGVSKVINMDQQLCQVNWYKDILNHFTQDSWNIWVLQMSLYTPRNTCYPNLKSSPNSVHIGCWKTCPKKLDFFIQCPHFNIITCIYQQGQINILTCKFQQGQKNQLRDSNADFPMKLTKIFNIIHMHYWVKIISVTYMVWIISMVCLKTCLLWWKLINIDFSLLNRLFFWSYQIISYFITPIVEYILNQNQCDPRGSHKKIVGTNWCRHVATVNFKDFCFRTYILDWSHQKMGKLT